ncbi:MAG: hypothetical protein K2I14_06705 [Eubacterium sp.]|nr:hypothetical protein [Eubacterium sp.]
MENNNFEQQNNQQFTDNNANPQQPQFYGPPPALDKKSTGLNILSFFIPLVGLILYLTQKDQTPIKAKGCGKAALIGFILQIVFSIVYVVVIFALVGAAGAAGGLM